MDRCDHFQIQLEQRARGELAPEESVGLDEHVARCRACEAYVTTLELANASLARPTNAPDGTWERVLERVRATDRRYRGAVRRASLASVALAALGLILESPRLLRFSLASLVLALWYLLVVRFRSRRTERLADLPGELVAHYRAELRRRSLALTANIAFCVASAAAWAAAGAYFGPVGPVVGLAFLGIAVYTWILRRRVQAELAGLDGAPS